MMVPDFWRGKGRFSKQALCRKVKDDTPYLPRGEETAGEDE